MNELNPSRSQIVYNQDYSLSFSSSSLSSLSLSSPLINVVLDYSLKKERINTHFPLIHDEKPVDYTSTFSANFPQYLNTSNTIKIPKKVERAIRYIPTWKLKAIHPNIEVAKEYCLLFLRKFNSSYFKSLENPSYEGWEPLHSRYLRYFFSTSSQTYKHIREALVWRLNTGPILECDYTDEIGKKCFEHRLGDSYRNKGIKEYKLRTPEAINLLTQDNKRLFQNATQNPICKNLFHFYSLITLPTIEAIHARGKELIKAGKGTKKGKRLAYINKRKKQEGVSYIEDDIKLYLNLTENGLRIPVAGGEKSGGRVVDSLNLMPSWIRSLIKIGDKFLDQCDYSCILPNIADSLYGFNQGGITHKELALKYDLDEKTVKKEHLSFFNKRFHSMIKSPLYPGYKKERLEMMKNLIEDKFDSAYGHKITSRRFFAKEVQIIKDVITLLNKEDIYVGYVYDALLCHPDHTKRVIEIMNNTVLQHGIRTTAKSE